MRLLCLFTGSSGWPYGGLAEGLVFGQQKSAVCFPGYLNQDCEQHRAFPHEPAEKNYLLSPDAPSRSRRCCFCSSSHASSPDDFRGPFASRIRHSHPHATNNPYPAHQRGPHATLCSSHHESPPASHDSTDRSVTSALSC